MAHLLAFVLRALSVPPDERSPLAIPTIIGIFVVAGFVVIGSAEERPELSSAPLLLALVFMGMVLLDLLGVRTLCEHLRGESTDDQTSDRMQRVARRINTLTVIIPLMAGLTIWIQEVELDRRVGVFGVSLAIAVIASLVGRGLPFPSDSA